MSRCSAFWLCALALLTRFGISAAPAAEDWPEVFNPFRVLNLHLQMDSGDWSAVQNDTSFTDERPGQFWADGETPVAVIVKRKSDPALGPKVSLKIDINDTVPGQSWHGLKKLSLENGAEGGIVKEGFAWQMHRLAGEAGFYDYSAAKAAWVRLFVNGELIGVYTHVEERDKQMLQNRGMWKENATWLYKNDPNPTLEAAAAPGNSPTFAELCYSPFRSSCAPPNLESNLTALIDMQGMLTLGAIEAFVGNRDGLFTHDGKNHFFADFAPNRELKRLYFPWDLDTGISSTTSPILGWAGAYQSQVLGHYWFRQWFLYTMTDLIDSPLSAPSLTALLNQLEPVLTPALQEDLNSGLESDITSHFRELRQWVTNRINDVRGQVGPVIGTPSFSPTAGEIVADAVVALNHTNATGTIYYTLDGTDPRALGGTPAGLVYSSALTLNESAHVIARVRIGTNWSALRQATFNVANHAAAMKVTEIHYAPRAATTNDDGGEYEFIELQNCSGSPVNLSGCHFGGLQYEFRPGTLLPASNYLVLVRNAVAFTNRYPGVPYHGIYWGALDSNGEKIRLKNSDGNNVFSVEYDNQPPWRLGANRFGWSLVNKNRNEDPDNPEHWRASTNIHGSPGTDDPVPPYDVGAVINEVLTHTDDPQEDAIELHNPTATAIDISGWFLSDRIDFTDPAGTALKRFRIPTGTVIPPGGFAMFYEKDFNGTANGTNRFALSSLGEQVYLASATSNGTLSGYIVGAEFDAVENGIPIGRFRTSRSVEFTPLTTLSFGITNPATVQEFRGGTGATNSGARIGEVIINEIMYRPDATGTEFIELYNRTGTSIDLSGWQVAGAGFTFPTNTTIASSNFLVIIGTTNTSIAAFRASNNVPPAVAVLASAFDLDNSGERLTLEKPNPDSTNAPLAVDMVRFNDRGPWPTEADGPGPSLEKVSPDAYGNEPASWRTFRVGGSPGRANANSNTIAIARGSSWHCNDLGRNLGVAWCATDYSDSGWTTVPTPVGRTYLATTLLSNTPGRVTTYLRKEFVVHDAPADMTALILRANYDDGVVAYLNGVEVLRASMSVAPVMFSTFGSPHGAGVFESFDLSNVRNLLKPGVNLLAVELHQAVANDTNIFWDAELTYASSGAVMLSPFRITSFNVEADTAILEWESVIGATYQVQESGTLGAWGNISASIVASNSLTRAIIQLPSSAGQRFFRVHATQ
jgi:hypothetical protein